MTREIFVLYNKDYEIFLIETPFVIFDIWVDDISLNFVSLTVTSHQSVLSIYDTKLNTARSI